MRKKNIKVSMTIHKFFITTKSIKNVLNFIKNIRICTKRWILGIVEDEEMHEGGWRDLE